MGGNTSHHACIIKAYEKKSTLCAKAFYRERICYLYGIQDLKPQLVKVAFLFGQVFQKGLPVGLDVPFCAWLPCCGPK